MVSIPATQPTALYAVITNRVTVTTAYLQPPYYWHGAPTAVTYGSLGFAIAHEMTHAFHKYGA